MTLQNRILELFADQLDKSPALLARFLKISPAAISDWMTGKTKKMDVDNVFGVAEFFGALPKWVGTGKGKKYPDKETAKAYGVSSPNGYYAILRKVPILGNVQLGDDGYWTDLDYPEGYGDGFIDFPTNDGQAYALHCVGESMRPRIKNGEFVIIEPNIEAQPGDEVLVKGNDDRVMIKKLLYTRADHIYLLSINENHHPISLPLNEISALHPVAAIIQSSRWIKHS